MRRCSAPYMDLVYAFLFALIFAAVIMGATLADAAPVAPDRPAPTATPGYSHLLLPGPDNLTGVYILCDPPGHLVFHAFGSNSGRVDCVLEP